jgi:hypothetical protein
MKQFGWLITLIAVLAALWWAQLRGLAVLATIVCGLAGLTYLAMRIRRPPLLSDPNRKIRATSSETYPRARVSNPATRTARIELVTSNTSDIVPDELEVRNLDDLDEARSSRQMAI